MDPHQTTYVVLKTYHKTLGVRVDYLLYDKTKKNDECTTFLSEDILKIAERYKI